MAPEGLEDAAAAASSSSAETTTVTRPERRVQYTLAVDTAATPDPTVLNTGTDTGADGAPYSPTMLRRTKTNARASTFKPVSDYDEFDGSRPGWQPGQEPGFDPSRSDAGHSSMPTLMARSDITIVDFSQERINVRRFDNEGFIEALAKPQADWVKCRWINVNTLSWDVVQAIGAHKKLHKLALEDVMELRNRTKVDW
jgi:hypothetical protein